MSGPDWNLAQVLLGVFAVVATISAAPPTINFLRAVVKSIALTVHRKLRPYEFVCERLEWIDIPEGVLHECTVPKENCQHVVSPLQEGEQNRVPIIFAFFKWLKRGNFVKKPKDLDLGTRYIRKDPIVLKAVIFLFRSLAGGEYYRSAVSIVIEDIGSTTTGYITPGPLGTRFHSIQYRIEVTKKELGHILEGYPPWYSEYLMLANGNSIPHPIQSVEDVARGGWIVAVGLSSIRPIEQECLKRASPSNQSYRPTLTRSFRRVSNGLRNTQKAFPANSLVGEVLILVGVMTPDETGGESTRSEVYSMIRRSKLTEVFLGDGKSDSWSPSWVYDKQNDYASGLSNQQCMMAIEIFNRYEYQLSAEVSEALEPILLVVLRAVMVGCYQVMDYFEDRAHFKDVQLVKMLKELESKRKPIYLREWKVGDEE
jgi:hypothetical protein